ncbi:MAG TPA: dihydrolipoyllysine-residue acetyltransferase, partial [Casimicrobiaceae bacterium]|nr:dihydrolipoyllysine-residue acetyltransferase [Casimicrobiaceae bacterium]
ELKVKVGDKVSEGSAILTLEAAASAAPAAPGSMPPDRPPTAAARATAPSAPAAAAPASAPPDRPPTAAAAQATAPSAAAAAAPAAPAAAPAGSGSTAVKVPDIGDFKDVPVIEVLVRPGDAVKAEDPLVTLESDKATMDVPAPSAGVVRELKVKVGDKVSEGSLILLLDAAGAVASAAGEGAQADRPAAPSPAPPPVPPAAATPPAAAAPVAPVDDTAFRRAHASPSVRAFARALGVDLTKVKGSGPKERILQEDVEGYVKQALAGTTAAQAPSAAGAALNLLPWPQIDFAKFGPVESKPLSRIKKISGANLHRNWVMIPHVTNHEDADITELEAFRVELNKENEKAGIKVTMLAFLIKTCVAGLKRFPEFNASLNGDNLVYKHYYHVGFAADTPNGLVVPVIRNADQKGVLTIAKEMGELSAKAREGKLGPADMQGGCFSISSLGGIGGTYFTPIINAPELAILGVSRSVTRPVWDGKQFTPRLILPLSLSYDHRVIDGAAAARFNSFLSAQLADLRRLLL